ncbi:MAG: NAD(P)H-dependent oxidoreductase subunit E [Spirochaetales bacterium]|nr:NAD(P)H-dependent oxidoreductase subunit E [Spirochaetales bacterium]
MTSKINVQDKSLLPTLLKKQKDSPFNFLSEDDVNSIAKELKLSRSRVYSTASFYSEISLSPRGKHIIRVCCNAPCENAGKEAIREAITKELGIEIDETTEDKLFTLESVNCLGACFMSPAMRIDDEIYGNLTPEETVKILNTYKKEHVDE